MRIVKAGGGFVAISSESALDKRTFLGDTNFVWRLSDH